MGFFKASFNVYILKVNVKMKRVSLYLTDYRRRSLAQRVIVVLVFFSLHWRIYVSCEPLTVLFSRFLPCLALCECLPLEARRREPSSALLPISILTTWRWAVFIWRRTLEGILTLSVEAMTWWGASTHTLPHSSPAHTCSVRKKPRRVVRMPPTITATSSMEKSQAWSCTILRSCALMYNVPPVIREVLDERRQTLPPTLDKSLPRGAR